MSAVAEFQQALTELQRAQDAARAARRAEHAVDDAIRAASWCRHPSEWAIAYCAPIRNGFDTFGLASAGGAGGRAEPGRQSSHGAIADRMWGAMLSGPSLRYAGSSASPPATFVRRKSSGADFLRLNKDQADLSL